MMASLVSWFGNKLNINDGDPHMPAEVTGVDLHCKENSAQHHTSKYALVNHGEDSSLVVRRGQMFKLSFQFNRNLDWTTDHLSLVFHGQASTVIELNVPQGQIVSTEQLHLHDNGWALGLIFYESNIITLAVLPPCDAGIGVYKMRFDATNSSSNSRRSTEIEDLIYLLFNPWHPADDVYMEDDVLRQEYVLNDYGKVYQGTYDRPVGKAWHFGQFDSIVLPTFSYLIELGKLTVEDIRSPVLVARNLSALVDQTDDQGILVGRWDNEYADGVSPMTWSSTTSILEMYMRRGGAPVLYGQCWVYAALVTTICRAIGMPCRPITNFESAHDTDGNMCIDSYSDENGVSLDEANKDSSWNFHLWNEAWMRRPDLGTTELDGWQAFDGTPQEKSDGLFRMGPCPVLAVRAGLVDVKYDTKFIFSETNAIFCDWVRDRSEPTGWKVMQSSRQAGKLILTKRPGALTACGSIEDAEDITLTYRCPTAAEELAAKLQINSRQWVQEQIQYDLQKVTHTRTGEPFEVRLVIKNIGNELRTVCPTISIFSLEYTGAIGKCVKRQRLQQIQVAANSSMPCSVTVSLEEYQDKITAFGLLKVMAGAKVSETQKSWAGQFISKLEMPHLEVIARRNPAVTREILYSISFTNPLTIPLSHCELIINIPGIATHENMRNLPDVPARGVFSWQGKAISDRVDEKNFIVTFNSDKLSGLEGIFTAVL